MAFHRLEACTPRIRTWSPNHRTVPTQVQALARLAGRRVTVSKVRRAPTADVGPSRPPGRHPCRLPPAGPAEGARPPARHICAFRSLKEGTTSFIRERGPP